MGKGRYLKAAERACSRKSRFETRAAAEAFVEGRYRAYRCVVCGAYHLTSGRGDRDRTPTLPSPKGEARGPKLGDLDWSAVLGPKVVDFPTLHPPEARLSPPPNPSTWAPSTADIGATIFAPPPSANPPSPAASVSSAGDSPRVDGAGSQAPHPCPSPPVGRGVQGARCAGSAGKDGRVLLVVAGRLVKSRSVERTLRPLLKEGVEVEIEGEPPSVIRVAKSI